MKMPMTGQQQQTQPLATIFVPWQEYTPLYPPNEALKHGTVFNTLCRPYTPRKKR